MKRIGIYVFVINIEFYWMKMNWLVLLIEERRFRCKFFFKKIFLVKEIKYRI